MTQQSFTNLFKLRWHQVWHQIVSMSTVDTSFKHCTPLFDFSNCQREQDEMVTFAGILESPSWLQNLPTLCKGGRFDRNSRANLRCHEVWHRSLCRLAIHHHTTPGQRKTPPSWIRKSQTLLLSNISLAGLFWNAIPFYSFPDLSKRLSNLAPSSTKLKFLVVGW